MFDVLYSIHSPAPLSPRAHVCLRRRARAFTLVEVIMAVLVVGVGLVATMRVLPLLLKVSEASRQGLMTQSLAADLMTEISLLPFEDPGGSPVFGPEPGESGTNRNLFNDIDDYNGWTESPPKTKTGGSIAGSAGYTRSVVVQSVSMANFDTVVTAGSSDAKRIAVTVSKAGQAPVTLVAVRLRGANREDPQFLQ
jgi:prepilin-type N-terminal cleavage/methylation domain-containing protein